MTSSETVHLSKLAEPCCLDILLGAFEDAYTGKHEVPRKRAAYGKIFVAFMNAFTKLKDFLDDGDIKHRMIDKLRTLSLKPPHAELPRTAPYELKLLLFDLNFGPTERACHYNTFKCSKS